MVAAEIFDLLEKTEDYLSNNPVYTDFASSLIDGVKQRFSGLVFPSPGNVMTDPVFLICALLDPFTAPSLTDQLFGTNKRS